MRLLPINLSRISLALALVSAYSCQTEPLTGFRLHLSLDGQVQGAAVDSLVLELRHQGGDDLPLAEDAFPFTQDGVLMELVREPAVGLRMVLSDAPFGGSPDLTVLLQPMGQEWAGLALTVEAQALGQEGQLLASGGRDSQGPAFVEGELVELYIFLAREDDPLTDGGVDGSDGSRDGETADGGDGPGLDQREDRSFPKDSLGDGTDGLDRGEELRGDHQGPEMDLLRPDEGLRLDVEALDGAGKDILPDMFALDQGAEGGPEADLAVDAGPMDVRVGSDLDGGRADGDMARIDGDGPGREDQGLDLGSDGAREDVLADLAPLEDSLADMDLRWDPLNCGNPGHACSGGVYQMPYCYNGRCRCLGLTSSLYVYGDSGDILSYPTLASADGIFGLAWIRRVEAKDRQYTMGFTTFDPATGLFEPGLEVGLANTTKPVVATVRGIKGPRFDLAYLSWPIEGAEAPGVYLVQDVGGQLGEPKVVMVREFETALSQTLGLALVAEEGGSEWVAYAVPNGGVEVAEVGEGGQETCPAVGLVSQSSPHVALVAVDRDTLLAAWVGPWVGGRYILWVATLERVEGSCLSVTAYQDVVILDSLEAFSLAMSVDENDKIALFWADGARVMAQILDSGSTPLLEVPVEIASCEDCTIGSVTAAPDDRGHLVVYSETTKGKDLQAAYFSTEGLLLGGPSAIHTAYNYSDMPDLAWLAGERIFGVAFSVSPGMNASYIQMSLLRDCTPTVGP